MGVVLPCETLNFKKRKNCLSCSTERPPQTREQVMPDWRTGKKDCGNNVNADWTCRACGKFNLAADRFCLSCALANGNVLTFVQHFGRFSVRRPPRDVFSTCKSTVYILFSNQESNEEKHNQ